MKEIVHLARRFGPGIVAASVAFAWVAEAGASPQRRGRGYGFVGAPGQANIDSSEMIEGLNKALKALGETSRDYDGHRQKAINHIGVAIRHLEPAGGKNRGEAAVSKALGSKEAANAQVDSDATVRKAITALFSVHHKLTDNKKNVTPARNRADAEVRVALTELNLALKPPAANTSSSTSAPAIAKPATKPAK